MEAGKSEHSIVATKLANQTEGASRAKGVPDYGTAGGKDVGDTEL